MSNFIYTDHGGDSIEARPGIDPGRHLLSAPDVWVTDTDAPTVLNDIARAWELTEEQRLEAIRLLAPGGQDWRGAELPKVERHGKYLRARGALDVHPDASTAALQGTVLAYAAVLAERHREAAEKARTPEQRLADALAAAWGTDPEYASRDVTDLLDVLTTAGLAVVNASKAGAR